MLHFFWSGYTLTEDSYQKYEYSNLEIAKWAEYYLSQKTGFHQSHWLDGKVTNHPEDILIGHLTWDTRGSGSNPNQPKLLRNWVTDNALHPHQKCHPNSYILFPWVPEFPTEWIKCMPFYEQQLRSVKKIFALCGEIWMEKTFAKQDNSIQYELKDKLIRSNMGVASQNFPIKKEKFNAIGERQLIHISNLGSYKGFDLTCMSLIGLDTFLHVVAPPSINRDVGLVEASVHGQEFSFNFIGNINNNDPEFNHWVVENCDFYIHTATMDAQATTILENAARGLIPLVTPESGFACPDAIYLMADPEENRKIIEWALNLPESELIKRSHLIREYTEREHNWQNIYDKIWHEILNDIEERNQN